MDSSKENYGGFGALVVDVACCLFGLSCIQQLRANEKVRLNGRFHQIISTNLAQAHVLDNIKNLHDVGLDNMRWGTV